MTKREFDQQTRVNFGCPMASDEREMYRHERGYDDSRPKSYLGMIDRRAAYMAWRNKRHASGDYVDRDGFLPTLAIGSRWRAVAERRKRLHPQRCLRTRP